MLMAEDGAGGTPIVLTAADTKQLKVETETLKQFRTKVDALLKELETSPASPRNISDQQLAAHHLGSGFAEANDLHGAYTTVHGKLQELSQTLSKQIEAMILTIEITQSGYQNTESDQVVALWKIRDQTDAAYQAAQKQKQNGQTGSASTPSSSPSAGTF